MSDEVILRAVEGALKDEEFVFDEKGLCLVGRSRDCALMIPKEKDMRISRRHCLIILDPPKARIRDLGSRNGTFVNDQQLEIGTIGDVPELRTPQDLELKHGDRLSIGETEFEVLIPSMQNAGAGPVPLPPGTKVIKLSKPDSTQEGSIIPKSQPVDSGFFISPVAAKEKAVNTSTAALTEAFTKPKVETSQVNSEENTDKSPKKVLAKKVDPQKSIQPLSPAPDATLILKAKSPETSEESGSDVPPESNMEPEANPEPPPSAPVPPPPPEPEPPAPAPDKPRKVLKGRIVKKPASSTAGAPPPAAEPASPEEAGEPNAPANARKEYDPELTEIMSVDDLSDDIKLSADYIKKEKANKRVTKFKVKKPK